jgi:hypothetical protein
MPRFTSTDITRLLKGAEAAGATVSFIEIHTDGRLVMVGEIPERYVSKRAKTPSKRV